MVYKVRVILNAEVDVIRDIAILKSVTLEDLHNAITSAFGLTGDEMASFYRSDEEWSQGEEFPLFDMGEGRGKKIQMQDIRIEQILEENNDKMIYVYDFFAMWSFYVELIDLDSQHNNIELPDLLFSLGLMPNNAPDIQFESEDLSEDDNDEEIVDYSDENFEDFNYN
jgi:hypothetical protein